MLLFQSTISEELIYELIHTGLTGDNKLKPLVCQLAGPGTLVSYLLV